MARPTKYPPHLQAKIDQALARLEPAGRATIPARAAGRPTRPERRAAASDWDALVTSIELEEWNERLVIWLPGLRLYSENVALWGNRERSPIQIQTAAKAEARIAFMSYTGELWRITKPVALTVLQQGRIRNIDPGNLYGKPVIDCLTTRAGGLGIIQDDSATYVDSVTLGYLHGELEGVKVIIEPAARA